MVPPGGENKNVSAIEITESLLGNLPLPKPDADGDKEVRGRLLIVGGSSEMPGTVILAATAALRAGAGKVQIATCSSIAPTLATVLLEGRVFAMPETKAGGISIDAAPTIVKRAQEADALLIGPGLVDEQGTAELLEQLLPNLVDIPIVLDAGALTALNRLRPDNFPLRENGVLTPHAKEMSSLMQCKLEEIIRDPFGSARRAAKRFNSNVLLKGAETLLALPEGKLYRHQEGNVGLATSGSGDVLAGLIAGLMARGASPAQAAIWSVYVHARAAERLARRIGPLGFLARELLPEVPGLLRELDRGQPQ